jgi:hypothetical protein
MCVLSLFAAPAVFTWWPHQQRSRSLWASGCCRPKTIPGAKKDIDFLVETPSTQRNNLDSLRFHGNVKNIVFHLLVAFMRGDTRFFQSNRDSQLLVPEMSWFVQSLTESYEFSLRKWAELLTEIHPAQDGLLQDSWTWYKDNVPPSSIPGRNTDYPPWNTSWLPSVPSVKCHNYTFI